jgi:hypothetical protein
MNKTRFHLYMFWRIFKSKTIWIKFLIFSSPKIISCFYFFSILTCEHYFSYLCDPSHTLSHISSLGQSVVRSNRAFGLSTSRRQPPLFAVSSAYDTVEPPRLLPFWKWLHPIVSPSLFLYPVTSAIELPPPLHSSPWLPTFHHPTAL